MVPNDSNNEETIEDHFDGMDDDKFMKEVTKLTGSSKFAKEA